jgi:two-component system, LytTR family, response regulator
VHFVALDDIEWIEATNNYVVVHAVARTYKGRERISDVEARLDARRFVRVHRSAIVRVAKIREVQPLMPGDRAIVLRSGAVARVPRGRRQALSSVLGVSI